MGQHLAPEAWYSHIKKLRIS
jgi:hypothetical protein